MVHRGVIKSLRDFDVAFPAKSFISIVMESLRKEVAAGIGESSSTDALESVIEGVLCSREDLSRIQQKALSRSDLSSVLIVLI